MKKTKKLIYWNKNWSFYNYHKQNEQNGQIKRRHAQKLTVPISRDRDDHNFSHPVHKVINSKNSRTRLQYLDCNISIAYQTTKKGEYVNMKLAKTIQAKTKKNTKKEVLKYIKIKSNKRKLHTPREKTRKRQGS